MYLSRRMTRNHGNLQHNLIKYNRLRYYFGAGERSRTPDLLITNELLYQLSYTGYRKNRYCEPANVIILHIHLCKNCISHALVFR